MAVNVQDKSPPLVSLAKGGVNVTITSTTIADEEVGRVKIEVMNAGTARIWLGIGTPAVEGEGNFIDPGWQWYEYTTQAINAIHGDTGNHLVTYQEWAA